MMKVSSTYRIRRSPLLTNRHSSMGNCVHPQASKTFLRWLFQVCPVSLIPYKFSINVYTLVNLSAKEERSGILKELETWGGGAHIYGCLNIGLREGHHKIDGMNKLIAYNYQGKYKADGLPWDNGGVSIPIVDKFDWTVATRAEANLPFYDFSNWIASSFHRPNHR